MSRRVGSCTDHYEVNIDGAPPVLDPAIWEARNFFEHEFDPEQAALKDQNAKYGKVKRHSMLKDLYWEKAHTRELEDGQTGVVIPVQYAEDLYVASPHGAYTLSSLTYALIYDDWSGTKSIEIVTTFPDSAYLAAKTRPDVFSGIVYVEDWNGNILQSIRHANGQIFVHVPVEQGKANARTEVECDIITDWYTCGSGDGGETWSCRYSYTEVTFGLCSESGGGGTAYNYTPATGGSSSGGGGSDTGSGGTSDEMPTLKDCGPNYINDKNGNCVRIVEPCETDNEYLNHPWFQGIMEDIWSNSNANDTSIPLSSRFEDGGWLVDNGNGTVSFVPFPATWTRTPCWIDRPDNWDQDIPDGAFALVHSHPFYEGEDTRSVCSEEAADEYTSGLSDDDRLSLFQYIQVTGYLGFTMYVIDGAKITIYDKSGLAGQQQYERCSY